MERKGKWTKGPVTVGFSDGSGKDGYIVGQNDIVIVSGIEDSYGIRAGVKREADSSLIASAFNAATTCEDMGYDGEACVKALPELVELAEIVAMRYGTPEWERRESLENIAELLVRCGG